MKKEVADLWVKALKSEKYSQIKGRLKTPGGHCCLGVLCDISKQGNWGNERDGEGGFYNCETGTSLAALPLEVMSWSGINAPSPFVSSGTGLSQMNDRGLSFEEIADQIEANWEQL